MNRLGLALACIVSATAFSFGCAEQVEETPAASSPDQHAAAIQGMQHDAQNRGQDQQ
jgi:hypothetical protein